MLGFSTSAYYAWLKTKEERDKKQKDYEKAITKIFMKAELVTETIIKVKKRWNLS